MECVSDWMESLVISEPGPPRFERIGVLLRLPCCGRSRRGCSFLPLCSGYFPRLWQRTDFTEISEPDGHENTLADRVIAMLVGCSLPYWSRAIPVTRIWSRQGLSKG